MEKIYDSEDFGKVQILTQDYAAGTTACQLIILPSEETPYHEPLATLSVYFPGASEKLPAGYFYVKDWSENELVVHEAAASGWFEPLGPDQFECVISGFVCATHVWKVRDERGEGFELED